MIWPLALALMTDARAADVTVQGSLTGPGGAPLEGTHPVHFRLIGATTMWEDDVNVQFTRGAFAAALGAGAPLPPELSTWDGDLSLAITVDGVESAPVAVGWGLRSLHAAFAAESGYAATAALADDATHATLADDAAHATWADDATNAGYATNAGTASYADEAHLATSALYATDAGTLAGQAPVAYITTPGVGLLQSGTDLDVDEGFVADVAADVCYDDPQELYDLLDARYASSGRVPTGASDPACSQDGDIYFNTGDNSLRVCSSGTWRSISGTAPGTQPGAGLPYLHYRLSTSGANGGSSVLVNELRLKWDGQFQINAMTDCSSGTVGGSSASINASSTYAGCGGTLDWRTWGAFDGLLTDGEAWNANGFTTAWLKIQLSTPRVVTAYTLNSNPTNPTNMASGWALQGSNDGATWSTLDTRVGQSDWGQYGEQRTYYIAGTGDGPSGAAGTYDRFRLQVNSTDNNTAVLVNEWILKWDGAFQTNAATDCLTGTVGGLASRVYASTSLAGCGSASDWRQWGAFDGLYTDGESWHNNSAAGSGWLTLHLPTPKKLTAYRLFGNPSNAIYMPNSWQVQGSNDGVTWTTLDTRTGQGSWGQYAEMRDYYVPGAGDAPVAGTNQYNRFRVRTTAGNGATGIILNEVILKWDGAFQTNAVTDCLSGTVGGIPAKVYHSTSLIACGGTADWRPWQAFDNVFSDGEAWHNNNVGINSWITLHLNTPKRLEGYRLSSNPTNPTYMPSAWVMEGSNDGVTWTSLDSRTGATNWTLSGETREYTITY
jgi:hypothetical protein